MSAAMKFRDLDDDIFTPPQARVSYAPPQRTSLKQFWGLGALVCVSLACLLGMAAAGTEDKAPESPVHLSKQSPPVAEVFDSGFEPAPADIVEEAAPADEVSSGKSFRLVGEMKISKLQ